MWPGIPPGPDPELEAKYARPRTFCDMAGGCLLGAIGFVLLLGGSILIVDLIR